MTRKCVHLTMYMVSHATRKHPGRKNLVHEEDNEIDPTSSINKVMQEKATEVINRMNLWHSLGANVCKVVHRGHMDAQ
jgi:hypothetical protein